MRKIYLGCLLSLMAICFTVIGCNQPLEQTARDGIAVAKGYIATAARRHSAECIATSGKAEYCDTIVQAAFAENAAVTALETYCQLPANSAQADLSQPCHPVKAAEPALLAALSNLNQFSDELKKASGQ